MSDKKRSLEATTDVSDSDDDMPIAEFVKKRIRKETAAAVKKENSSKSNDNKKSEKSLNKATKITAKATKTIKTVTKEKNDDDDDDDDDEVAAPPARSKITSTDSAIISSKSMKDYIGRGFYENSLKGKLVQCLLRRWWYAYEWPEPKDIPPVPTGYQALDGFPGVFISTRVSLHTSAYTYIHTYIYYFIYNIYTLLLYT